MMTIPPYTDSTPSGNLVVRRRPIAADLRWLQRYGTPDVIGAVEATDEAWRLAIELAVARAPRNEALLRIAELLQTARRHRAASRAATPRRRA